MSVQMEQAADAIIQAANEIASLDDLSDVEAEPHSSSSLSEIEYKESHLEEDGEASDDQSNDSDDENDSEAETERLEESPNKVRTHKDVVLSSHNGNQVYERSPSKLHNQIIPDTLQEDEEDDLLSDDDLSVNESPKSSVHDEGEPDLPTAPTSLEDSAGEGKRTLSITDADSRKRKRSIMAGSALDDDDEPLRKRTGSIMAPVNDYAIDDEEEQADEDEEIDTSNPVSGDISGEDGGEEQEEEIAEEVDEPIVAEEEGPESIEIPVSPKKRGGKTKKIIENGLGHHEEDPEVLPDADAIVNGQDKAGAGEEETAVNEGDDEAEAAARNEEELEKKRIAADELFSIERQFTTFRDKLYDERLEALNREEAMLRDDNPTHPKYLAMMQAIDARRDERLRINDRLRDYEIQTLKVSAVAKRSQILVQFQQDVRDIRERVLEQLGKQWYEIQHDRRSYAGNVPDYTLKFPTQRSQQVMNQIAYSNEVSILSGIAKYVGFPAAPPMAMASDAELTDDFAKMGRSRQPQPVQPAAGSAFQELAALRTAGSTSRFKPAEEQFIEQTPWANPQHPSHAHLLQRQTSAQQAPRTTSPFAQPTQAPRRHSQQPNSVGPISGTFSTPSLIQQHPNGASIGGGRISPLNHFAMAHARTMAPSPLGSRPASLSPRENRQGQEVSPQQPAQASTLDAPKNNGIQSPPVSNAGPDARDHTSQARRALLMGQF